MNREELPPTVTPGELPPDAHRGLMARFRNYFLTGLIVAGPIAITFYLTWWFVTWVDGLVRPFVPVAYRPETYLPFGLPGSGLIVAVFALTMLGFLTANLIGRKLVDLRRAAARPHAGGARDLSQPEAGVRDAVLGQGSSFRRVGLVEFPSPGMWSIVLISQPPSVEVASSLPGKEEHISVFLPCAPNPTTGFLLLRAEEQDHRSRDERRGRRHPDHVRRRGAARLRPAEEAPRWPAWQCRAGGEYGALQPQLRRWMRLSVIARSQSRERRCSSATSHPAGAMDCSLRSQ